MNGNREILKHTKLKQDDAKTIIRAVNTQKYDDGKIYEVSLFFITNRANVIYREKWSNNYQKYVKKIFATTKITHNNLHKYLIKKINNIINTYLWEQPKEVRLYDIINTDKKKKFIFIVVCKNNNTVKYCNRVNYTDARAIVFKSVAPRFKKYVTNLLLSFSLDLPSVYAIIVNRRRKQFKNQSLRELENADRRQELRQIKREKLRIKSIAKQNKETI